MRLKYKHEIENYEHKANVLRENGWDTWYHDDNWIKLEWYKDPKIRIDHAGISTDSAYYEYSEEKIENDLKIINNHIKFTNSLKLKIEKLNENERPIELD